MYVLAAIIIRLSLFCNFASQHSLKSDGFYLGAIIFTPFVDFVDNIHSLLLLQREPVTQEPVFMPFYFKKNRYHVPDVISAITSLFFGS